MRDTLDWALAFSLTQAIEVPVYLLALRGKKMWQRGLIGFGASALTHPYVWFVLPGLLVESIGGAGFLLVAELFAWGAEGVYLSGFGVRRCFLWSLVANGASFAMGLALSSVVQKL